MILSKSLLVYHLRQLRQSPATGIFLTCGWLAGILLTFISGQLISTNRAELTGLFTYLPWIMAVLIPTLTMPVASEARRGVSERLLTLPHTPIQRLYSRFAVTWALLGVWILGFWPLIATLYYLGSPDLGPIATGLLGTQLLAAPMLAISLALCLRAKSGVSGLLASLAACLLFLLLGTATVTAWFSAVPGLGWLPSSTSLTLLGAYQPFTQGLLNLSAIFLLIGLTLVILGVSLQRAGLISASLGGFLTLLALIPTFNWLQLDATAEALHTPSPITIQTLAQLPSPVTFTLHVSQNNPDVPPSTHTYIHSLTNSLLRLRASAPDKVILKTNHTDASTPAAIRTLQAGATEQSLPTGTTYFAALVAEVSGHTAVIPILQPTRQAVIEYDLMTLVTKAQRTTPPTVTIFTPNVRTLAPALTEDLRKAFEVRFISDVADLPTLLSQTTVLLVPDDAAMPPLTTTVLRNYLGQGGNIVLLADAFSRTPKVLISPTDQPLSTLLPEFGLTLISTSVIADPSQPTMATQAGAGATAYPYWLQLNASNLNADLPFTTGITKLFVPESGALMLNSESPLTLTPILTTSAQARSVPLSTFETTPAELASTNLPPASGKQILAAMASGDFTSQATKSGNLIVFADTDWLTPTSISQSPDNLTLLTNTLNYFSGQNLLTQLRTKGATPRTLTRIEDMANRLTQASTVTEQKIATRLYEVNQTLNNNPENLMKAQEEEFTLRQQLREVRQQTRQRLQGLENALLLLNLALMPTIVGLLFLLQRRRQRLKSTSTL